MMSPKILTSVVKIDVARCMNTSQSYSHGSNIVVVTDPSDVRIAII